MLELGELESRHAEFEKRGLRVVVVSIEGQEESKQTQADFPHLRVVSDEARKLADAAEAIHVGANPNGGDALAPTTILIDGTGTVRWVFRPDRVLTRLSPAQVLAAADRELPGR